MGEFIVHLAETQLKKEGIWDGFGTQKLLEESQKLKQRMAENGAPDLPLSLCKNLLEWIQSQSPRIQRWMKKQKEKGERRVNKSESSADGSRHPLSTDFPALAKPNLQNSVTLDEGFYEHDPTSNIKSETAAVSSGG